MLAGEVYLNVLKFSLHLRATTVHLHYNDQFREIMTVYSEDCVNPLFGENEDLLNVNVGGTCSCFF